MQIGEEAESTSLSKGIGGTTIADEEEEDGILIFGNALGINDDGVEADEEDEEDLLLPSTILFPEPSFLWFIFVSAKWSEFPPPQTTFDNGVNDAR